MTEQKPDDNLISEFMGSGSETAFHALVNRHAAMVHATALRQVGQSTLAEEVTQNTFLALARKAPSLRKHQTIAGWLHRCALLEAKATLRRELRRQSREHKAAELNSIQTEGNSRLTQLVPILDEAEF